MMQCYPGKQCMGKNKLNTMVKRMCEAASVPPKMNYSLKATSGTEMFQAGILKRLFRRDHGIIPQKLCGCMSESQMSNRKQQQQYFPPLIRQITIHCFQ